MAVLVDADRVRVWKHLMRNCGALGALTKADLRAAINDTDTWIDTNQAAYNTAVSLPARTALTTPQKTMMFCFVAMARAGLLRVDGDA